MENFVLPGDYLGTSNEFISGNNTHVIGNKILSSKAGIINKIKTEESIHIQIEPFQTIPRNTSFYYDSIQTGSLVICRAKSLTDNQCKVDIICVRGKPLISPYKGVIQLEDIRLSYNKDFTKAYHSFQIGDIIVGRVIGVFDNRSFRERIIFHISTSEKELGVILAKSRFDEKSFLIPVSWSEMICPVTHKKELRKVAKVIIHDD